MHADPGDVVAASFYFTGVHTDAYLHAELVCAVADREPTLNRPRRTVEASRSARLWDAWWDTAEASRRVVLVGNVNHRG